MMHIGETDAYEALVETFSGPPSVILEEGVTDREELLEQVQGRKLSPDALEVLRFIGVLPAVEGETIDQ